MNEWVYSPKHDTRLRSLSCCHWTCPWLLSHLQVFRHSESSMTHLELSSSKLSLQAMKGSWLTWALTVWCPRLVCRGGHPAFAGLHHDGSTAHLWHCKSFVSPPLPQALVRLRMQSSLAFVQGGQIGPLQSCGKSMFEALQNCSTS